MRPDETLVTIAIDRSTGKVLWERAAPKVRTKVVDKRNNPASPSPAVEDNGVYVFFPDYGMVAYDAAGQAAVERCRSGRSTTSTAWAPRR